MAVLLKGECDECGHDLAYRRRAHGHEHTFDMTAPGGAVVNLYACLGCGKLWVLRESMEYEGFTDNNPLDAWVSTFPGLKGPSRELWKAIKREFDEQQPPMTVRQMFYRMSSGGHVAKSENGYRGVQYALTAMRKAGAIPYGWLADNTRWVSKPETYQGIGDALNRMQQYYRRDLWANQPVHVELWLEKDALRGVVSSVTSEFDVPLYVTRGYASLSYLHEAAESLKGMNKPVHILHFGDFDASGQDAARSIRDGLRGFGARFTFHQVAVTERQISEMGLQTRPSKKSDPRAAKHGAVSVELDAIPPATLRRMVRDSIEQFVNAEELAFVRQIEKQEQSVMIDMARDFGTSGSSGTSIAIHL